MADIDVVSRPAMRRLVHVAAHQGDRDAAVFLRSQPLDAVLAEVDKVIRHHEARLETALRAAPGDPVSVAREKRARGRVRNLRGNLVQYHQTRRQP